MVLAKTVVQQPTKILAAELVCLMKLLRLDLIAQAFGLEFVFSSASVEGLVSIVIEGRARERKRCFTSSMMKMK